MNEKEILYLINKADEGGDVLLSKSQIKDAIDKIEDIPSAEGLKVECLMSFRVYKEDDNKEEIGGFDIDLPAEEMKEYLTEFANSISEKIEQKIADFTFRPGTEKQPWEAEREEQNEKNT